MPIYEYKCHDCQARFEELVLRRTNADNTPCKTCASANTERVMSVPAVAQIKSGGSGGGSASCPAATSCPSANSVCCAGGCAH